MFIFNCDIIAKFPLQELENFHTKHGHFCTILTKKMPQGQTRNYGCVVADPETKEILHYAEKPETFVSFLSIFFFKTNIFILFIF